MSTPPSVDPFARVRAADPLLGSPESDGNERLALARIHEQLTEQRSSVEQDRTGRGWRRTPILIAACAAGAIAIAAVVTVVLTSARTTPSRTTSPNSPPQFSVLREPATSVLNVPGSRTTTLPTWLRTNPAMRYADVDVASARLSQRTPTRDYYVARAQQGKAICLIDAVPQPVSRTYQPGNPGGVTCRYTNGYSQSFAQGFVTGFLAVQIPSSATSWVIAGVVPDGFTRVRAGTVSAPVINNTYVLAGAKPWLAVTATGPGGSRTVWLGMLPPQPTPARGTPLAVSLFRQPPTPPASLPRFVRNSLRDPPSGRHAWLAGDFGGQNYWVLTTGRLGSPVVTIINTSDHIGEYSTVTVENSSTGAHSSYVLLPTVTSRRPPGVHGGVPLTNASALGRALVGKRTGDIVSVAQPGGTVTYRVTAFDPGPGDVESGGWPATTTTPASVGAFSYGTVSSPAGPVANYIVFALVGDGYTTLAGAGRSASVTTNFVGLSGLATSGPPVKLTLTGPAGTWSTYLPGPGLGLGTPGWFGRIGIQVPY